MSEPRRGSLDRLFAPRSIAVVGASPSNAAALRALATLRTLNFPGSVAAVNPRYEEVAGVACYPSLTDLPAVPDAILVTVGAERVLPIIEEAARLGVGGAVVPAMGFAEAGPEGEDRQRRLADLAAGAGLAVIGPNCQGIVNFAAGSALYLRAVQPYSAGRIAVISQSGSMATSIVNSRLGARFRYLASTGNEAVLRTGDLIDYFSADPEVSCVLVFAETIRDAGRFADACDRAFAREKPVIVLQAGATARAQAAAHTHSGALAAPARLVDAFLRAHHAVRVDSIEDLLTTGVMADGRRARSNRLGAVTLSGGQIALFFDHAAEAGVEFPSLQPATAARLGSLLPDFLTPGNPLDVWGMADLEDRYGECLAALAEDDGIDVVMTVAEQSQYPTGHPDAHSTYYDAARAVASRVAKPVLAVSGALGSVDPDFAASLARDGVTTLGGFRATFQALGHLARWEGGKDGEGSSPDLDWDEVEAALAALGPGEQAGLPALSLLAAAGVALVPAREADSPDAAAAAADALGYPVAVKSGDPSLLHKTETGALALGLTSRDAVGREAERLQGQHGAKLIVQAMAPAGVELIVGSIRHPELGPFVMVGMGGIWVEVLDDVVARPAPVSLEAAAEMIASLKGAAALTGARGQPTYALGQVADAIARLSQVASRYAERLVSVDVNPLVVSAQGTAAVDAAVALAGVPVSGGYSAFRTD